MKTFKRIAIAGGALVLLGIIVFVIGMSVLDWDFARLSTRPPYVEKALEFDNDNQSITLDDKDMRIKIGVSPDEKIRIVYYEREKELYEGQYDEGNTDAISFVKKMTYTPLKTFSKTLCGRRRIRHIQDSMPSRSICLIRY